MHRSARSWSAVVFALVLASVAAGDEPWDRFRGPNGSGLSEATTIPAAWTDADYNWKVELPGSGLSSPVIRDGKLFITAADEEKLQRYLLCYDVKNGRLLWQQGEPFVAEKKHLLNSYATGTPAVDAERVYIAWQARTGSQLIAYDHAGKQLWRLELGPYKSGHGGGLSPVVVEGVVALNNVQEGESFLLGVDAATGRERWRVPRKSVKASYSTPCAFTAADGKKQLVFTSWLHGVTGVDPATGRVLWENPDAFDRDDGEAKRAIGSPFTAGGYVYGNCGFVNGKKYLIALRPDASSNPAAIETTAAGPANNSASQAVASTDAPAAVAEAFRIDKSVNHMPSAIAYNGLLFLWSDAGIVACAKADTGKILWQRRLGGNYSGSPVCVGGKLYCLSEDAEMVVLAASEDFEELGRIALDEGSRSTPAVADGVMYFRTHTMLYSIGKK